jgi:hypothetical protein
MNSFDILALAKANNDTYLAGYRVGFEAGYREALDKAVAILERVPKPSAVRTLVAGEPA